MSRAAVAITTPDGTCPASVFTPDSGNGPWPGVIFFMDGLGIRPAIWEMGQRLANGGYAVLMPDLFYRAGPYEPMIPSEMFGDPAKREVLMKKFIGSLDRDKKISDAGAFIDFLDARSDVKGERLGSTGYCMGGNIALTAAGAFPEKFAVAASFHGGNLATDKPDSPHLTIGNTKAYVYVGGAIEDASFPDEQKDLLEKTLADAHVAHLIETYSGAHHGWAMPDFPVYNVEAAERHWSTLLKLYGEMLG
jgi:carboxymethylenebutenolidase